ncbi:VOC family protein [Rhodococcus spongiicola]|uniref:VOC family protein n=1 Tax=Rhodococcus spongiicola TaxID=2487352 RepID=A0A3S3A908_9NOCA|nr:VOC family protein [Rhodococcus spongiicola]RVW02433.1 VOC family protein [Rhodococcus spongiicola]
MTVSTEAAIDRSIYPMPMFASFLVRDLEVSERFYHQVGFITLASIPGPTGVQLIHLRREKYQDVLLVQGEAVDGSVTVSLAAGAEDLAARADALAGTADLAGTVEGPTDTPWFTTDLTITDPDGNRIILTAPRTADHAAAAEWLESARGEFRS